MVSKKRYGLFVLPLFMLLLFSSACSMYEPTPMSLDKLQDEPINEISFQEFLWEEHPLDLIIQIGLLLAGAFGVTALLPSPDEEKPKGNIDDAN